MSGDLPYHLAGYQQSSGDGNSLFNIVHPSQNQHSRFHPQNYQRLKVEDALSYLDKVKLQFSNQPEVYNKFLDIMKEFKSQTIDTPGVIDRVSRLFEGHSELIVGFNTFLPPGYKIEMSSSSDSINVLFEGKHVPSLGSRLSGNNSTSNIIHSSGSSGGGYESSHLPVRQESSQMQTQQRNLLDAARQRAVGPLQSSSGSDSGSQPVEFDHAISYVNKIKCRYQGKPEVYKSFLEILHVYQKVQRESKDGITPVSALTEAEVYSKVATLFKDQPDLLAEFGQFLPDAGGNSPMIGNGANESSSAIGANSAGTPISQKKSSIGFSSKVAPSAAASGLNANSGVKTGHRRRLSSTSSMAVQPKKLKTDMPKDVSLAEAGKYGSLNDFAFFDKVRKVLNSVDQYEDFLRCLKLYTMSVISSSELLLMVQPFFAKAPEMKKRLKELVRQRDDTSEPVPAAHSNKERTTGEFAMHIDFASCKLYTASYRGLPSSYVPPRCSGRTELCNEVLNDTIVSVPSWSEDSSSVIKKTMAEEQIFRCEEDRYQLDIVLENVNTTILVLNGVLEKLNQMTTEDQAKFHLDNSLGGHSEYLHRNTILKLYREHGLGMLEALKRNPAITVPLVLHRLRAKATELREAKRNQQKVWNEQNHKYFSKSLDHQGLYFKQNDAKALRSKALLIEIENAFEERQEQLQNGIANASTSRAMLSFTYRHSDTTLEEATSLILHHMKRQTSIHSDDKRKIKRLLKQFLPTFFFRPSSELSDDEEESGIPDRDTGYEQPSKNDKKLADSRLEKTPSSLSVGQKLEQKDEEAYSLMFANSNWYILFRLHYALCDRLAYFRVHSSKVIAAEKERPKTDLVETAYALCLKATRTLEPVNYYSYFLEMVRNYLDGNLETVSYEEQLREMFGIHAYIGFTMDKLVQNIVRQLQHIVADTVCVQLVELHMAEQRCTDLSTAQQKQLMEQSYQRKSEQCMGADNCFRISVFRKDCRLAIDMLEVDSNQSEPEDRWTDYMNSYVANDESVSDTPMGDSFQPLPTYLKRNVRRSMKYNRLRDDNEISADNGTASSSVSNDVTVMDDTECRFDINSYHRVYVVNKDTFLYRHQSLSVARKIHKKVSLSRHKKFDTWVKSWLARSATKTGIDACTDFLLGRNGAVNEHVACVTEEQTFDDENTVPYYAYKRYHVTFPNTPKKKIL